MYVLPLWLAWVTSNFQVSRLVTRGGQGVGSTYRSTHTTNSKVHAGLPRYGAAPFAGSEPKSPHQTLPSP